MENNDKNSKPLGEIRKEIEDLTKDSRYSSISREMYRAKELEKSEISEERDVQEELDQDEKIRK